MKIMVLVTFTDCENKHRSLTAIGHDVHVVQYDDRPHDRHGELVDEARTIQPDAIVFIGAVEKYHLRPVPYSDVFLRLREIAPTIHMCNDASDPPWWIMLEEYHARECFDVQVNIDGGFENPLAGWDEGLVLLTPIDHRPFLDPPPWPTRSTRLGMVGGYGNQDRRVFVDALLDRGLLTFNEGPADRSYDEFAHLMGEAKAIFNYPATGSNQRFHVKGRVVEAGFAGCLLLEKGGSPTNRWFAPGLEYLEYDDPDSVATLLDAVDANPLWGEAVAARFRDRVVAEHHPAVFWGKVFAKAGLSGNA